MITAEEIQFTLRLTIIKTTPEKPRTMKGTAVVTVTIDPPDNIEGDSVDVTYTIDWEETPSSYDYPGDWNSKVTKVEFAPVRPTWLTDSMINMNEPDEFEKQEAEPDYDAAYERRMGK